MFIRLRLEKEMFLPNIH